MDLISGKLVVDRVCFTPTSIESVGTNATGTYYWVVKRGLNPTYSSDLVSSHFNTRALIIKGNTYVLDGTTLIVVPVDQSLNTKALADAWLQANKPQFVYKIATPQEYQLTPAQLRSLVGTNNLTSSTGEVTEVEYIRNETISWVIDQIQDNSVEWTVIP